MPRPFWIGLGALLALAAGVFVLLRPLAPRRATALPRPTAAELANPDSGVVSRAMQSVPAVPEPVDSVAYKQRWLDEVRGVDLAALDPRKRELFLRFANAERCTCGCGYTLAGCRASDMTCETSGPMIDALLDSVRAGLVRSAKGVRSRPRSADGDASRAKRGG